MRAKKETITWAQNTRKLRHMEIINAYLKSIGFNQFQMLGEPILSSGMAHVGIQDEKGGIHSVTVTLIMGGR